MKTAVSIPDEIFKKADIIARRTKRSRSRIYSDALREYVARHSPDEVTEAMNRVIDDIGQPCDEFAAKASARVLEKVEW
jgi:predicted transcriptional regulator